MKAQKKILVTLNRDIFERNVERISIRKQTKREQRHVEGQAFMGPDVER